MLAEKRPYSEIMREVGCSKATIAYHAKPKEPTNNPGRRRLALSEVLIEGSQYGRYSLKKRLFKHGMLRNECYTCGMGPVWHGKPISLQLDHINGVNNDHRLDNLRILCPNCHTQTKNYGGKATKGIKRS